MLVTQGRGIGCISVSLQCGFGIRKNAIIPDTTGKGDIMIGIVGINALRRRDFVACGMEIDVRNCVTT